MGFIEPRAWGLWGPGFGANGDRDSGFARRRPWGTTGETPKPFGAQPPPRPPYRMRSLSTEAADVPAPAPPKHPPWPPADSPAPGVSVSFGFSTFFPPLSASPSTTCPPPSLHLTWGCALAPGGAEKGDAKAGTSLTQGPGDVTVSPAVGTASIQLHASGPARFPAMDFLASLPFPGCHPQGAPMVISSPRHLPFSLTPPLPRDDFKRSANELPAR